jgi:outer membrane biosynthesis protein TonB
MSKKILPLLVVTAIMLSAVIFALPHNATASPQLGITPTEPPVTETPVTPTEPPVTETPVTPTEPPVTETPVTPTEPPATEPPPVTESPKEPKETEIVLLPATGESPIDSSHGMQWFFALTIIFLIGFILIREVKSAKIKK